MPVAGFITFGAPAWLVLDLGAKVWQPLARFVVSKRTYRVLCLLPLAIAVLPWRFKLLLLVAFSLVILQCFLQCFRRPASE